MSIDNRYWLATFVIWGAGAVIIWFAWHWHPRNQALDLVWGFILYLVAFFYVFTLGLLRAAVEHWHHRWQRR